MRSNYERESQVMDLAIKGSLKCIRGDIETIKRFGLLQGASAIIFCKESEEAFLENLTKSRKGMGLKGSSFKQFKPFQRYGLFFCLELFFTL